MLFIWHSVFDSYYSQHSGWYIFSAKESKRYKALFISCSGFWLLLFKRRAHPVFMFFYCPGNIEKERMVISDARQRKQGRQKSVLPPVSSWRNLAGRFTFGVSKCKVFSSVFQWTGCCASFGICFCLRELSLERIHAVLPFFLLNRWECLVFYLWGLLSYACWQQRMKQLKSHYSILIFALTPFFFAFLNKSGLFLNKNLCECVKLWVFPCGKLSPCLPEFILQLFASSNQALALAGANHVVDSLHIFVLLLTLYLHDCLSTTPISCFLQSS